MMHVGIWLLSVVFGTCFAYSLYLCLKEGRVAHRFYLGRPEAPRTYKTRKEHPVDYWMAVGAQAIFLAICIVSAMRNL